MWWGPADGMDIVEEGFFKPQKPAERTAQRCPDGGTEAITEQGNVDLDEESPSGSKNISTTLPSVPDGSRVANGHPIKLQEPGSEAAGEQKPVRLPNGRWQCRHACTGNNLTLEGLQ